MIPALNAASLLHAVAHAHKPHPGSSAAATNLVPADPNGASSPSGSSTRNATGSNSIASDLGQLTTDALQLLGLGGSTAGGTGGSPTAAAQAYAASGGLVH